MSPPPERVRLAHLSSPSLRAGFAAVFLGMAALSASPAMADRILDARMRHLRSGADREWTDFPEHADGAGLLLQFEARGNETEQTLRLRHRDLRQQWKLSINGREIAGLPLDENDMVTFWAIPPATLKDGRNELGIACQGGPSDDVLIGDIRLIEAPLADALSSATLKIQVHEQGKPAPCRITIVDEDGSLMSFRAAPDPRLAARPGVLYAADGAASISLPAGSYTIYAGRGFEYSVASAVVSLQAGQTVERHLSIQREVDTTGYAACDPHCHTWTYSRHGDATLAERVITLAGEGVEIAVATDHNIAIEYDSAASAAGVRHLFTPWIGNEVTTPSLGHFNVFPLPHNSRINHRAPDWNTLAGIFRAAAEDEPIVILNHPRDVHGGFRPFDAERHIAIAGEDLDGWKLPANAMEVLNSSAIQTDPMRLFHDWFGLLNRGIILTPIGSSDSHDVSRYIVGQGRTYIRCDDGDPGNIPQDQALRALREGGVLVSYGLLVDMTVEQRFGPGQLASVDGELDISIRVSGPGWTTATYIALYANGIKIREEAIESGDRPGLKWQADWKLPPPAQDVHLVAIATGPGVDQLFWPTARPYQKISPEWQSYVLGATGAVFVDADGSGRFESAHDYAARILQQAGGRLEDAVPLLHNCRRSPHSATIAARRSAPTHQTPSAD